MVPRGRQGPPGGSASAYVDYYHFAPTPTPGYVRYGATDIYYSAAFSPDMPDLNLDDPDVRTEIAGIVAFWLGRGVDGFRLDATTSYYPKDAAASVAFLRWLKTTCTAVNPKAYLVGEAWTGAATIASYYGSGVDSFFDYPFATVDGAINTAIEAKDGAGLSAATQRWNETILAANPQGMDAPFISNHDNPRPAGYLLRSAQREKLAAATYLLMPGSPFLYYGEEIGMVGSGNDPDKRMPMVWSRSTQAGIAAPPPGGSYDESGVVPVDEQIKDPRSVLNFYRSVLDVKRRYPGIARGTYAAVATPDAAILAFSDAYQGTTIHVVENLGDTARTATAGALGLASGARIVAQLPTGDDGAQASLTGGTLTLPPLSVVLIG